MKTHLFFYACLLFLPGKLYSNIDDDEIGTGRLQPGNYRNLKLRRKNIECEMLLNSKVHDIPAPSFLMKPFKTIPISMQADFTYDGKIKVEPWYFENSFPTNRTSGKIEETIFYGIDIMFITYLCI